MASSSPAAQADAVSLPASGPASLLRDGERLVVDVRFEGGVQAGDAAAIRRAGGDVRLVSPRYGTVVAAVAAAGPPRRGGGQARAASVAEELSPMVALGRRPRPPRATAPRPPRATRSSAPTWRAPPTTSTAAGSRSASSPTPMTGARPTPHAAQDVATGDLPGAGNPCGRTTPVQVLDDTVVGADEGRAMAQIVHDLAPGARLAFATASSGELGFADNIRDLATANSDVIVDDVTYFNEPFFQDGPIAAAVNDVVGGRRHLRLARGEHQHHLRRSQRRDLGGAGVPIHAVRAVPAELPELHGLRLASRGRFHLCDSGPERAAAQPRPAVGAALERRDDGPHGRPDRRCRQPASR